MTARHYQVGFQTLAPGGVAAVHYYGERDAVQSAGVSDVYMEGRLQRASITRAMYSGIKTRGPYEIDSGAIELQNADGGLDALFTLAFDSQSIGIASDSAGRPVIFQGTMEQPTFDRSTVQILLHDTHYVFTRPLLPLKYAGTNALPNGIEGVATDLKGKPKPMILGPVKNISPPLVNTALLVYQVDGQQGLRTGWSMTVYDKRVALVAGAVYVSQVDMETNAPAVGQYRVWPAGGCFRLGSTPIGQITADVDNPVVAGVPNWTLNPAPTANSQAHMLVRALQHWAADLSLTPYQPITPAAVSTTGARSVDANFAPPVLGVYFDSELAIVDAINQVAQSVGATWAPDYQQMFAHLNLWRMTEPGSWAVTAFDGTAAPVVSLAESDILDIARVLSADDERGIPVYKVILGYGRNYTVQNANDVAGAPAADIAFVGQEYRLVTVEDDTVLTQWPYAKVLQLDTLIASEADALAEATRLLGIYKPRRDFFQVKVPLELVSELSGASAAAWVGQDVLVTHSRFGMAGGVTLRLLAYTFDAVPAPATATLTLWR
jgi:hypothetical protein